jgi:hypothetical protein
MMAQQGDFQCQVQLGFQYQHRVRFFRGFAGCGQHPQCQPGFALARRRALRVVQQLHLQAGGHQSWHCPVRASKSW